MINDFGDMFTLIVSDFIVPLLGREISFFGFSVKIGAILAFCFIGTIVLMFVEKLLDD